MAQESVLFYRRILKFPRTVLINKVEVLKEIARKRTHLGRIMWKEYLET